MSLLNAMYAGVSGLGAEGKALAVVGDNVANVNTIAFKHSRTNFEDVLGGTMGAGVRVGRTQQLFAQGTMLSTGQPTDIGLQGDGFFVVRGNVNGAVGDFYTRAGQMMLRKDGTLANSAGLALQGYQTAPNGTLSASLGTITVPTSAISPKPTSKLAVTANLDATATTPALPWDPQNPGATSNLSTAMQVYDSLGNARTVDVYLRKTGAGTWDYHALVDGSAVVGGVPGVNQELAAGTLTFTNTGALQSSVVTAGGTANFVGAAPAQPIAIDFGQSIAAGGTGLTGTTQFGSPSNVSAQSQDGYASGDLSGVKIEPDGTVRGLFTNGQALAVGKLAVAKFRANDGLERAGQNLWAATSASGEAALGTAGSGGRGAIVSGALEQSNVDIAAQFVELMTHQRGFQANSKTITTADQMLQTVLNIKQ